MGNVSGPAIYQVRLKTWNLAPTAARFGWLLLGSVVVAKRWLFVRDFNVSKFGSNAPTASTSRQNTNFFRLLGGFWDNRSGLARCPNLGVGCFRASGSSGRSRFFLSVVNLGNLLGSSGLVKSDWKLETLIGPSPQVCGWSENEQKPCYL